jgi:hypothetical protein
VRHDDQVFPRVAALATCLCEEITRSELPEPCRCDLVLGEEIPDDLCGDCSGTRCGTAWVRLVTVFPSSSLPDPDVSTKNCVAPLAFEAELGIMRCSVVGDSRGNPPSVQQRVDEASLALADMQAMYRAIMCCYRPGEFVLGTYTAIGPAGGCVGGTWSVVAAAL